MKNSIKYQKYFFGIACLGLTFSFFSIYEFYIIGYNKAVCLSIFVISSLLMIVGCPVTGRIKITPKVSAIIVVLLAIGLIVSPKSILFIVPIFFMILGNIFNDKGEWYNKILSAGESILFQLVVFEIIYKFAVKIPHTKAFNYVFWVLSKVVGFDSSIINHDLYVRNEEQTLHFDITLDALGIYFWIVLIIPYIYLLLLGIKKDKKLTSVGGIVSVAFLLIR